MISSAGLSRHLADSVPSNTRRSFQLCELFGQPLQKALAGSLRVITTTVPVDERLRAATASPFSQPVIQTRRFGVRRDEKVAGLCLERLKRLFEILHDVRIALVVGEQEALGGNRAQAIRIDDI